jgi:hypothetical protein
MVWPLGEEWDEQCIEQALFGERQVPYIPALKEGALRPYW